MKNLVILTALIAGGGIICLSFYKSDRNTYRDLYFSQLAELKQTQLELLIDIEESKNADEIKTSINASRLSLKKADFWLRYLQPVVYKSINGPLPVEWETELWNGTDKSYKRIGAGLTLAELTLEEGSSSPDSLAKLIRISLNAIDSYLSDSITNKLSSADHFFLCNRLHLLNLAAIYTTGFECPDTSRIIPELVEMMNNMTAIYSSYNDSYSETKFSDEYLVLYQNAIRFVKSQPQNYSSFDHFGFIRNYINPLFRMNQELIQTYKITSANPLDYTLNSTATSIFSKQLYKGQETKGVFKQVTEPEVLVEIKYVGRLLFFDPVLSGNNKRACASCHNADGFFTQEAVASFQFDKKGLLNRNTLSLLGADANHLLMHDGKHVDLISQLHAVATNPVELGSTESEIVQKVLSCDDYKTIFEKLLPYVPGEDEISFDMIASAIIYYYTGFSSYESPFDMAMNDEAQLSPEAVKGFNLFMSSAQCATCHFVPHFNGVKPPYAGSEFEVLGVPKDTLYSELSPDKGRYDVNPATETLNAFRTGTLKNIMNTGPYMHNGVFTTIDQVLEFYNGGGGAGRGLDVPNQTLSSDSLHLDASEKQLLISFLQSLSEEISKDEMPDHLPVSSDQLLNSRKVGGEY